MSSPQFRTTARPAATVEGGGAGVNVTVDAVPEEAKRHFLGPWSLPRRAADSSRRARFQAGEVAAAETAAHRVVAYDASDAMPQIMMTSTNAR